MNRSIPTPMRLSGLALILVASFNVAAMVDDFPWTSTTSYAPDNVVPGTYFNLGPTGIRAKLNTLDFQVIYVFPNSPAHQKILAGDTIIGVNGRDFVTPFVFGFPPAQARNGGKGPPKDFGMAIEESEGSNGNLSVKVRRGGTVLTVNLALRALGKFSTTFPYNCPKSDILLREICEYLVSKQNSAGDWPGGIETTAVAGLVLLGSGNSAYLKNVQRAASWISQQMRPTESGGLNNWPLTYGGIFMAEYYIATRDPGVIEALGKVDQGFVFAQLAGGFYQHQRDWGGYDELGIMNGLVTLAWGLIKQTGVVNVSQASLDKVHARVTYNTAPDGNVAYGGSGTSWGNMDTDLGRTGAGVMGINILNTGSRDAYVALGAKYIGEHQHYFPDCHGSQGVGMQWSSLAAARSTPQLRNLYDSHIWYINMSRCFEPGQYVGQPSRAGSAGGDYWNFPRAWQAATIGLMLCLKEKKLQVVRYRTPGVPDQAPVISGQPANASVTVGSTAFFSTAVVGTAPFNFQWQRKSPGSSTWANVSSGSGAVTALYTSPSSAVADHGSEFRCVVSNSLGSATSNAAVLAVAGAPIVTTQPADQSVAQGATATFNVVASGTAPLAYQWQKQMNGSSTWTNVSGGVGATTAAYTTPAVSTNDNAAKFRCVVSNSVGSVTSNAVGLTVTALPSGGTLKVYLLAGQSNMEGHAYTHQEGDDWLVTIGYPDATSLEYLLNNPTYKNTLSSTTYSFLPSLNASFLAPRSDAWAIHMDSESGTPFLVQNTVGAQSSTWTRTEKALQPGFGAEGNAFSRFGPELGLGHRVGQQLTDPVYLFKSDRGGTTLAQNWRPPSAVSKRGGTVGNHYKNTVNSMKAFLAKLQADLADDGKLNSYGNATAYELCGFVWLQGFNDNLNDGFKQEYKDNLIDLMRDMRAEFNKPALPQIIVECSDGDATMRASRITAISSVNQEQPGKAVFVGTADLNKGLEGGYHFEARAENFLEIGWRTGSAILSNGFTGGGGTTHPPGPGRGVAREWWLNIPGTAVSDLTGNTDYPSSPSGKEVISTLFEGPKDWADNYGTRMHGYFIAPATGAYTFYIASDDRSELWLSTDSNPSNAVRIAQVTNWTNSREWTFEPSQKSAQVNLVGGNRYYIRALQKEGSGGDNLAVGVDLPGGVQERPIPGHRLDPWESATPSAPSNLTAAAASAVQINLAWNDTSNNESGFLIERKTGASGAWSQIASVGANVSSYANTGLSSGTHYYFRVRAASVSGNSGYSNEANTTTLTIGSGIGLRGDYYDNPDFTAFKFSRVDESVNFDWGDIAPADTMGVDAFSVRWTGQLQAQYSEVYTFSAISDDGVRLWVNGQLIIDNWTDHAPTENSGTIALAAGQRVNIRLEYYEQAGGALIRLQWASASTPKAIVPKLQLFPAAENSAPRIASAPTAIPNPATTSDTVAFSVAATDADGESLTYQWDFGDGSLATGLNTSHRFSAPGTYNSTVTVSDPRNGTATQSVSVVVTSPANPPPPPIGIKINFQPKQAPAVSGYWADGGVVFGDRGNGQSYGWTTDVSSTSRDRNAANSPNQLYDTLIHLQKINASWEIALPNGDYSVRVVCGDPSYFDSVYRLNVENVLTVSGTPSTGQKWFEGTKTVTVSDGRLSLTSGTGAMNNKLCFVEINSSAPQVLQAEEILAGQLNVTQSQAKLSFTRKGTDAYRVRGSIPGLAKDFAPNNTEASVDLGAAIVNFTLDGKGVGKNANGSLILKYQKKLGWQFRATTKRGAWSEPWSDGGLRGGMAKGTSIELPLTLTLGSQTFCGAKSAKYSVKEPKLRIKTMRSMRTLVE